MSHFQQMAPFAEDLLTSIYQDLVRKDIEHILNGDCLDINTIISVVGNRREILQELQKRGLLITCSSSGPQCPSQEGYRTYHGLLVKTIVNLKFLPFSEYLPLVESKVLRGSDGLPGIKEVRHNTSQIGIDLLINQIGQLSCDPRIKEAAKIVTQGFKSAGISYLSAYQVDYILEYVRNKCSNAQKHYLITAPTGSGKTLIFTFMALLEALLGNKVFIVYPRKQLAEDQANTILKYIYNIRSYLNQYTYHSFNLPSLILVDGDHPNNLGKVSNIPTRLDDVIKKTLKCPIDGQDLILEKNGTVVCPKGHLIDYLHIFKDDLLNNSGIVLTNRFIILTRLLHKDVNIRRFLENVKLIIFDEAHTYINLEGGDTALLIRSLRDLVARLYGHDVSLVLSSATMPSPLDYAEDLIGVSKSSIVFFNFDDAKYRSQITKLVIPILLIPTPNFSAETVAQFVALATLLWAHQFNAKALMFVDSREEISRLVHYIKDVILTRGGIDNQTIRQPGDLIIYHSLQGLISLKQINPYYKQYNIDCNSLWDELLIHPINRINLLTIGNWQNVLKNEIEAHHAWLAGTTRTQLFNNFKSGNIKLLLATSTLELGIDVPDVSVVIQYKLPFRKESFIQRLGRAGRSRESYRIVIGILILSQSPTSAAYMYEEELARSLVDISKLPKLPINKHNYKLRLRHQFYNLLIEQKLHNKETHYPSW